MIACVHVQPRAMYFPLSSLFHITHRGAHRLFYVNTPKIQDAILELSVRNVDFAKLLSAERRAIGKQTLGTVRMMHRRQWIRKQFPIYFL